MSRSNFRQWLQRWQPLRWRSQRPAKSLFRRLFLEELESRWVPATDTWIALGGTSPPLQPIGGDWDTASNWSLEAVPTMNDDAVIPAQYANVLITHNSSTADAANSVTSAASMSFAAGSLSITTTGQFNNAFTMTGGTLSGAGTITLNGPTSWSGGTMSGTGETILDGSSTISGNTTLDTRTLDNTGTLLLQGTPSQTAILNVINAAVINNASGAAWDVQNGEIDCPDSSSATFSNAGAVNVQSGVFFPGVGGTDSGSDSAAAGTLLEYFPGNGIPYNLTSTSDVIGAGSITFGIGTVNVAGGFTPTGPVSVADGSGQTTVNFANTLNDTGSATLTSLTVNDGTLTGPVAITVTGTTGTSTFSNNNTFDTLTLNNFGTLLLQGTPSQTTILNVINAAVINNESGAAWDVQNGEIDCPDSSSATFNNAGAVNVQSGVFFPGVGGTDSGSDSAAAGTLLEYFPGNGIPYNLTATSDVIGAGSITFGIGTVNVAGGFTPTGPVSITDSTANFTNTVNGTGSATFTSLTLNGTLTGTASITVTGATTWTGGTMSGSGETDLLGSSTINPNGVALDTRTLDNGGTLEDNENIAMSNGAVINNDAGATWLLVATNATVFSGTGTFNNAGTFNMEGAGTDSIAVPFNNSGLVSVQSGTLQFAGGGATDPATFTIAGGTTLDLSNGTMTFNAGTLVNGSGTLVLDGATLDVAGSSTLACASVAFTSGALTDSDTLTLAAGTTFALQDENIDGSGTVINLGTILSNNTVASSIETVLNSSGALDVVSGTLSLDGGGTDTGSDSIAVGATLNFSGNMYNLNVGSNVTGAGGVTFSGGTVNVAGGFTPTGAISIVNGTADFTNTVNGSGSATFTSLDLSGTLRVEAATLTGSGTITVTGATTWRDGIMSGTGVTNLLGDSTLSTTPANPDTSSPAGVNFLDTRTLNNFGSMQDSGLLSLSNSAVINNRSGATWNLQGDASITGSGTFNNFGTLQNGVSASSATIAVPLNNISGGTLSVQSGTLIGAAVTNAGTVTLAGSTTFSFTTFTQSAGLLDGDGTLAGTVVINGGVVSPGFSPGLLTVQGNDTLNAGSSLNIEIAGLTAGSQYDVLAVAGTVQLGGTLNVSLLNGFVPAVGASFQFLTGSPVTGTFATVTGLSINGSESFALSYGPTSATLTVVAVVSPPALIVATSGSDQSARVNTAFANPLVATVTNDADNPVAGVTVTLAGPTSGAGVTFPNGNTATTSAQGQVSFDVRANDQVGSYDVIASVSGVSGSASFALTNTVGAPALIVATSGSGQSTAVNTAFANPLVATVTDAFGNPVAGVTVTFAGPTSGAGATFPAGATAATNAQGQVSLPVAANSLPSSGSYIVSASVAGVTETAAYNLTNTAPPPPPPAPDRVSTYSNGVWTLDLGANGTDPITFVFGATGDQGVVGDWSGDGFTAVGTVRVDTSVVGPNGKYALLWSLDYNDDHTWDNGDVSFIFGEQGDQIVVGDWNGDGKTKVGVVRPDPTTGVLVWSLDMNDTPQEYANDPDNYVVYHYGLNGDQIVTGDWTGDGKDQIGVVRANPNVTLAFGSHPLVWSLDYAGTGVYSGSFFTFGTTLDSLLVGDWNGDGKTKAGVAGPDANDHGVDVSLDLDSTGISNPPTLNDYFGSVNDIIFRGDWNGGGKDEIGVVRSLNATTLSFTLDSNGDGVYDAGDAVFALQGSSNASIFVGNWKGS